MAEARYKPPKPSDEPHLLLSFIRPGIHQNCRARKKNTVIMMSSADTIVKMISDRSSHTGGTIHLSESLENVGLDSMEVVSLIFDIEEAFNIQIPLNANMDIEGKTVADLIQSVDKLVAAKVASN
jgi:acyl carrier protein